MTVMPVIGRELRASSRQTATYWLRAAAVGILVAVSLLFGAQHGFGPNLGGDLFARLHFSLFAAIWILVPVLTADCISRERREGTLGLLFLTRLKAPDIVIAKGLAHGLRALTLWLAVLPVVTIPLMMGGVSWSEAMLSLLVNFSSLTLSLAAGLLGSAWSKVWVHALVRSVLLAICFLAAQSMACGMVVANVVYQWNVDFEFALLTGFGLAAQAANGWRTFNRLVSPDVMLQGVGIVAGLSLVVLIGVVVVGGARVRQSWQERPLSSRQLWIQQVFCTPVLWVSFFRRWMKKKLERNPLGWLEQRTWTGRLVTSAWFAVLISVYSTIFTTTVFFRRYDEVQRVVAWLLAGSIALSAASSFRRERESGVLELLLVSPMGETQILKGRLRGLWEQFLPSAVMLFAVWLYIPGYLDNVRPGFQMLYFAVMFFTLPIIGLYFSLRCRSFIAAFAATVAVGLITPLLIGMITSRLFLLRLFLLRSQVVIGSPLLLSPQALAGQVIIASLCWQALVHRLKERAFPLERASA